MEKPWDLRERTMQFALAVADYCKMLAEKGVDGDTCDQLRRSSASVAANYRAGKKGRTGKEFIGKFCIAIEEADESHFWLTYLLRTGTVSDERARELQQEAGELTGILIASVRTRRKNMVIEEMLRTRQKGRKPRK
jgi:four helix bundle protein